MIRFTLSQLAAIAHGERQGSDVAIDEVTTDTRKVTAGCLFVALKGERFDAHDFAEQAKAAGAPAPAWKRPLGRRLPPG
ncbi:Mur ligase domain-containing protein, partial [Klebsiella pneumoniae]